MLLLYGLAAWFVFMVTAVINGTIRVSRLQLAMSEYRAHVVSTLLLCLALLIEISVFLELVGQYSQGWLIALGALWFFLTLAFEFGFGRLMGQSWATLLENYDVLHGRIWPLVLLVVLLTPMLAG
jgi:protein-S-isoprenylcysteine O-methyltransferase Ste14